MDDNRLNLLTIMNIESEITESLKYKDDIEEFVVQKVHRKIL